jgi:hypothetical protein
VGARACPARTVPRPARSRTEQRAAAAVFVLICALLYIGYARVASGSVSDLKYSWWLLVVGFVLQVVAIISWIVSFDGN